MVYFFICYSIFNIYKFTFVKYSLTYLFFDKKAVKIKLFAGLIYDILLCFFCLFLQLVELDLELYSITVA